jgi:hypothetical protein
MDTRRTTNWLNQRFHQWEHSLELSSEKLVHKRQFQIIFVAILVLGLIMAFIFAQMPIAGETP